MNHEQAEWMLRALANQTAALERIAAAVEAIAQAHKPVFLVPAGQQPPTWGGPVTGLPEHGNGV